MKNPSVKSILPAGPINPVPELHEASTFNFDYQLVDGKIYLRATNPNNPLAFERGDVVAGKSTDWTLLDGIGIPYDEDMQSLLAPDEKLVALAVASEIIIAVSSTNRVYLFKPTDYTRPLSWEKEVGAPDVIKAPLYLPDNCKDLAFSCSVRTKPTVRTTESMNNKEIVSFFSDANGINFDFGFTPTLYVLDKEGYKITYWDTGLPPSFSRGFLVPEGMKGLSLSAAGSTIFLSAVDSDGQFHFYTRMHDYEINGSCPGLAVSYKDVPAVKPDTDSGSYFLGDGIRQLPLAGWREHDVQEIMPHLSDKVCIRLTGEGDESRQLRIQAEHPEQGWGYYAKNIFENHWQFYPEPAAETISVPPQNESTIPDSLKLSYDGVLYARQIPDPRKKKVASKVTLALEEFHPFLTDSEPFYLVLKHPDPAPEGSGLRLKIHAVDAWGFHYHQNHDDKLFGSVDGEPKALIGTLVLTEEQQALAKDKHSPLGAFVKKYFLKYDGKTKSIPIIADNGMTILMFGHKDCRFTRQLSEQEINNSFYMQKAMDPSLTTSPESVERCNQLLIANQDCLTEIKTIFSTRRKEDAIAAATNFTISMGHPIVSSMFKVYSPDDPTYKQAVEDTKLLFRAHKKATGYSAKGKTHAVGYEKAIGILNQRIANLQKKHASLTGKLCHTEVDVDERDKIIAMI